MTRITLGFLVSAVVSMPGKRRERRVSNTARYPGELVMVSFRVVVGLRGPKQELNCSGWPLQLD
jgi:hypothetical protein